MKKKLCMTTAQKSKETKVDESMINLCSVYPANNPYIYALLSEATRWGLLAGYTEQRLIPFPSIIPILISLLF